MCGGGGRELWGVEGRGGGGEDGEGGDIEDSVEEEKDGEVRRGPWIIDGGLLCSAGAARSRNNKLSLSARHLSLPSPQPLIGTRNSASCLPPPISPCPPPTPRHAYMGVGRRWGNRLIVYFRYYEWIQKTGRFVQENVCKKGDGVGGVGVSY